ncbi:hypothetical protein [Salinarimonas sp.]|uniref:hypothetical protein n=1 Tax=Salinarimonas sp. TaxID=2766526 RepID=UPI0032D94DE7
MTSRAELRRGADRTKTNEPRRLRSRTLALLLVGAALAGAAGGVFALTAPERTAATQPATAPGLPAMTPEQAAAGAHRLGPALLGGVYEAFGETEEGAIYERLSTVAHGAALEALYLERAGAMAGGGLAASQQEVHLVRMIAVETRRDGDRLIMDAVFDVIGSVGHDDHIHVRGNRYGAALTVAPAGGAWKIAAFALTEVDRSGAGERVEADHP